MAHYIHTSYTVAQTAHTHEHKRAHQDIHASNDKHIKPLTRPQTPFAHPPFTPPHGHASAHVLSGRLLFRPLHESLPQSWHGFVQNARPPLPLHSFEPHLQQCRMRFCIGSDSPASGEPSTIENVRFSRFASAAGVGAGCGAGWK